MVGAAQQSPTSVVDVGTFPPPTRIIALEGIPGTGKTEVIRRLRRVLSDADTNVVYIEEDVPTWRNFGPTGVNLLHASYTHPKENAAMFQIATLGTMVNGLTRSYRNDPGVIILERSIVSNAEVFAAESIANGSMSPVQQGLYELMHDMARGCMQMAFPRDNVTFTHVLLQTPPEVCIERVQARRNCTTDGENQITLSYMQKLYEAHDRVFDDKTYMGKVVQVPFVEGEGEDATTDRVIRMCGLLSE